MEKKPIKYCQVCESLIHKTRNTNSEYCSKQCYLYGSKKIKQKYQIKNRVKINYYKKIYKKNKYKNNDLFNLQERIRSRLRSFFKYKDLTKSKKTLEIIGCDWEILKKHIESQFKERMTWENKNLWQIDHIIPLASAKSELELIKLCHYTNLQPLWAKENLQKGKKY